MKPHALVPALLFLCVLPALPCLAADVIGELTRMKGTAEVERPRLRQLAEGDRVLDGETVTTGPDARLLFHLTDDTELVLGGDSRFAFDSALVERGPVILRLVQGAFSLTTEKADMTVITPLGTIGIRGTRFWGGFFEPDELGVFLFSGHRITVTTDAGEVELEPGQGTFLRPGQPPTEPASWGRERLTSAARTVSFD